jgi:hypothetical protein
MSDTLSRLSKMSNQDDLSALTTANWHSVRQPEWRPVP